MKRIVALLGLAALTLFILAQAVQLEGLRTLLVPMPDKVVQNFVSPLSSKRYAQALNSLNDALREQEGEQGLEQLEQALEKNFGEFRFGLEGETQSDENHARYDATLQTQKQGAQRIEFELERNADTQLWEISSLEDLKRSAQR